MRYTIVYQFPSGDSHVSDPNNCSEAAAPLRGDRVDLGDGEIRYVFGRTFRYLPEQERCEIVCQLQEHPAKRNDRTGRPVLSAYGRG
jgi:hypothetical protein